LRITMEEAAKRKVVMIAGLSGKTAQAKREAQLAKCVACRAVMRSLAPMKGASIDQLIEHCSAVAADIPLIGFYLQRAVGGIPLAVQMLQHFHALSKRVA